MAIVARSVPEILILVLIAAAVLAGTIRYTMDAVVILAVVVIHALLGFYQNAAPNGRRRHRKICSPLSQTGAPG